MTQQSFFSRMLTTSIAFTLVISLSGCFLKHKKLTPLSPATATTIATQEDITVMTKVLSRSESSTILTHDLSALRTPIIPLHVTIANDSSSAAWINFEKSHYGVDIKPDSLFALIKENPFKKAIINNTICGLVTSCLLIAPLGLAAPVAALAVTFPYNIVGLPLLALASGEKMIMAAMPGIILQSLIPFGIFYLTAQSENALLYSNITENALNKTICIQPHSTEHGLLYLFENTIPKNASLCVEKQHGSCMEFPLFNTTR